MKKYAYKLTDQNLQTHNGFQWELGKWYETPGTGELCSAGWLHFYTHPLLAVLLNPIHANITNPRLFRAEVKGKTLKDRGLKEGWTEGRIVKELKLPNITLNQKIAFGILCSLQVYKEKSYIKWAKNWLSGKDRTIKATAAAVADAADAAYAVAAAAADAADAARAAARAATAAAVADAADAAYAVAAAADAADAARAAARAAAAAAVADAAAAAVATAAAKGLNLIKLAKKALRCK